MSKFRLALVLLFLASCKASAKTQRVVCNFFGSATARSGEYEFKLTDIPVSLCTHVVYGSETINVYPDEDLILNDPRVQELEEGWQKFSTLKRTNPDLKLLMSVHSPYLPRVASKQHQRKQLATKLIEFMERYKLDGVELMWSASGFETDNAIDLLIEELKSSFRAAGHPTWEVIMLLEIQSQEHEREQSCRLADYVHLIASGDRRPSFQDNSTRPTGNVLFNIDDQTDITLDRVLQYWIDNGCPAEKIVLGVIFMAQVYEYEEPAYVDELTTLCSLTEHQPVCTYMELCQTFNESNWTMGWDDAEGLAPHAYHSNRWYATYENEASVGRKGKLAREKDLAGVYALALDVDDYRGKCGTVYPLTKALSGAFRQKSVD